MRSIVITGGHHNAALVVAKLLHEHKVEVTWIGHRHSSRVDLADSSEYIEVQAAGIPFHNLNAARLLPDIREIFRFPLGLWHAHRLLRRLRPDAVLSFGGYLGGTVALASSLLGIPIYLHEQTISAGKANKFIGRLAARIYLTWPDSTRYFPPSKTQVVGLPLRPGVLNKSRKSFFTRRKPTLLVMGGKQGAHVLNQFVFSHLPELLTHFNVLHQTGTNTATGDYIHAVALQESLGSLSDCYLPVGYISETEIGRYLHSSNLYFGRSGAHICYELGVVGLPAVLVPLYFTHDHEQHKNAQVLAQAGLAQILVQSELSLPHFLAASQAILAHHSPPLSLPLDAAITMTTDLLSHVYGK